MKKLARFGLPALLTSLGLVLAGPVCAAATDAVAPATDTSGLAAVYSGKLAGHTTASGKKYDPAKLTAAHRTLPFGTAVKVTNPANGKSVTLTITDRGPKQKERILDISASAAHALGIGKTKMAPVTLEVVSH